jgi:arginine N-succinyltransferase
MFIHQFRRLFGQKIFAEMRGFNDDEGQSPFWNALGKQFFNLEFDRIDFLTGRGQRSIIAELMPKYPVYSHLLSDSARQCIGKVHPNTEPALNMLKQEGFRYENYIAIFDGGPVMEAYIDDLRLVQQATTYTAKPLNKTDDKNQTLQSPILLCNDSLKNFRCTLSFEYQWKQDIIELPADCLSALELSQDQQVSVASLYAKDSTQTSNQRCSHASLL